jgi:rhomboid-like protein
MNHAPTVTWRTVGFSLSSASSQRSQLEIPRILSRISKTAPHNWWSYGSCRQSHVLAPRHRLKSYSATTTWTQQELGIAQWTSRQLCLAGTQRGQRQYSTGSDDFGKLTELEYRAYPDKPKSLPNAELAKIYGKKIPKQLGNELLQILQKQRVTGTLDYDVELHGANDNLIASGLSWLRKNYPLDEDAAIIKRIEREERSQEAELIARGERLGLYKPQQNTKDGNVYGESQIENLRKENEAKWEAERKAKADREKAEAEAAVARGGKPGGLVKSPKSRAILEKQKKDREWVQHYYEKAKLSKHTSLDQLQKMSKTERLLPSAVFVAVIVAGALFCAAIYKPPPSAARIFSDTPPAIATVTAMMALNTLAWLAWKQPRFWLFMNRYFLMSVATPHPFSLLGNVFSHMSVRHLAMNMVMMWFIGTQRKFVQKSTVLY